MDTPGPYIKSSGIQEYADAGAEGLLPDAPASDLVSTPTETGSTYNAYLEGQTCANCAPLFKMNAELIAENQ